MATFFGPVIWAWRGTVAVNLGYPSFAWGASLMRGIEPDDVRDSGQVA